jgi:predicted metal-dependent HD superfamily phosphohydrolase
VQSLLDRQPLYRTATGARLWEKGARRNLSAELHPTSRHWSRHWGE